MPGITGLETLAKIKETKPNLPVVMITKNEEEEIMDEVLAALPERRIRRLEAGSVLQL